MPPLTLTVLGASPAAPNVGGACSGYLLRDGETAVVMDCGSGVAGRIGQHLAPNRLTGVVISHLHPDHYFDIVPLYYVLRFGEPRPAGFSPRLPLFVPPGGSAFLRQFAQRVADKANMLDDVFEVCDYPSGSSHNTQIGGLRFSFHPVQHYVLSHAMRVQASSGAVLVFSSDVGPCRELVEAARNADLLLCESALVDPSQDEPHPERRGHMSAGEAGSAAREAGVRRLVLTHYRAGPKYDDRHRDAASRTFGAAVELAREGETYTVG
jgi:ribonuclease BN (tRNA processing enzyme)